MFCSVERCIPTHVWSSVRPFVWSISTPLLSIHSFDSYSDSNFCLMIVISSSTNKSKNSLLLPILVLVNFSCIKTIFGLITSICKIASWSLLKRSVISMETLSQNAEFVMDVQRNDRKWLGWVMFEVAIAWIAMNVPMKSHRKHLVLIAEQNWNGFESDECVDSQCWYTSSTDDLKLFVFGQSTQLKVIRLVCELWSEIEWIIKYLFLNLAELLPHFS